MSALEPANHLSGRGERLTGSVAIISGAGSAGDFVGIGAATAVLFAAQGAVVGVVDVSPERAIATCAVVTDSGGTALPVVADVTDRSGLRAAVDRFAADVGRLDIVVNNAGISQGDWDTVFAVNATGTMSLSEAAHPHLVDSGGGSIINVSSIASLRGFGGGAYAASKGAVNAMTTDLAYRWGLDGIRVNCLVPGHLYTPMGDAGGSELRRARREANLLGTEGTAWDVAWAALFLAGPEARWITGAVLPVDAGTTTATGLAMKGGSPRENRPSEGRRRLGG